MSVAMQSNQEQTGISSPYKIKEKDMQIVKKKLDLKDIIYVERVKELAHAQNMVLNALDSIVVGDHITDRFVEYLKESFYSITLETLYAEELAEQELNGNGDEECEEEDEYV